jgi:hypothetical protein
LTAFYDSSNFKIIMKNKLFVFTFLIFISLSLFVFAQEEEFTPISVGGANLTTGVNCFDYYRFPSIDIILQPGKLIYQTGEVAEFKGVLRNQNDYPIVEGNLFIQIFRKNPKDSLTYGDYLVDEFFALENIYLNPFGEKSISFDWQIPKGLSPGKYLLAAHFVVAKRMNLAGLSFIEGIYGGITEFEIESKEEVLEVLIDKTKVSINGQPFFARNFVPQFEANQPIEINFSLQNLSAKIQEVEITKRLFFWDNLRSEQLKSEEKGKIKIEAGSTKSLTSSFKGFGPGVYLFEIIVNNQGVKSILKVRFAINGENPPARFNFSAIGDFPIKKGKNNYIFSCFHSVTDRNNFDGKVILNLKDKEGNLIESAEYQGSITPQMMTIKKDFVPNKDYDDLILESSLYDKEGRLVERVLLNYECSQFKEPAEISLFVKKGILNALPLNICGENIPSQMAIEVSDQNGNVIFFEPSLFGNEFKKKLPFKEGMTYKITALSSGVERTIFYTHRLTKLPIILYLSILVLILVLFIVWRRYYLKGKPQKTKT